MKPYAKDSPWIFRRFSSSLNQGTRNAFQFSSAISPIFPLRRTPAFSLQLKSEMLEKELFSAAMNSSTLCMRPRYTANFVDRDPDRSTNISNSSSEAPLFQKGAYAIRSTDVSMAVKPVFCKWGVPPNSQDKGESRSHCLPGDRNKERDCCFTLCLPEDTTPLFSSILASSTFSSQPSTSSSTFSHPSTLLGDKLMNLDCRWSSKFYGQVTFGPRGFAYPSSRWLARRFRMKKHKILKRFRFRRYKLAAIANLPFAKMIRVGMLPELKSSKTRKGDAVDGDLSTQLVQQVRSSTGGKVKGRRSRPKSKYQV